MSVGADFSPEVVNCNTTDETIVARVFATIPPVSWAELKSAVEKLEQPCRPGLFLVDDMGNLREVDPDKR